MDNKRGAGEIEKQIPETTGDWKTTRIYVNLNHKQITTKILSIPLKKNKNVYIFSNQRIPFSYNSGCSFAYHPLNLLIS